MNFNQIKWFCSAYETGSFVKAAAQNYISRQALSKAIKSLEAEIGATLFMRDQTGLAPTPLAIRVYPLALRLVQDCCAFEEACDNYKLEAREQVTIAVADTMVETLPMGFFSALERKLPFVKFSIEKHFFSSCMQLLEIGQVDFAVVPGPIDNPALKSVVLMREPLYIAAIEELLQRCLGKAELPSTLEELAQLPLYSVGEGSQGNLGLEKLLIASKLPYSMNHDYTEYNLILEKAMEGQGLVLVPQNVVPSLKDTPLLLGLMPTDSISWEVNFVYHPHVSHGAHEQVVDFMSGFSRGVA